MDFSNQTIIWSCVKMVFDVYPFTYFIYFLQPSLPIRGSSVSFTPHTLPLHSVFTSHNTHSHVGFTTITPCTGLFREVHSTHTTTTFCIYSTQHSLTCWFYNHHSPYGALPWGSLHTHTLPLHSVFTAHNTHSHVGFTTITPHTGLFREVHSTHTTTTFCINITQHSLTCWFYNHHSPYGALPWGSLHTHYHYILY